MGSGAAGTSRSDCLTTADSADTAFRLMFIMLDMYAQVLFTQDWLRIGILQRCGPGQCLKLL